MRSAINTNGNIIGNSASIRSARAMVAAGAASAHTAPSSKRLSKVDFHQVSKPVTPEYPVVVRESLCERQHSRCLTMEMQSTKWQPQMWRAAANDLPAVAWATLVLNRTSSI
ncbi:hypothetical protein SH668x_000697 [Planctomicrobium sp. SH668]|uniref:hypothetical protein n=1 Tax=Planctomicrobium sp. SH668 TaxID=3448126 RepID=UPI003F5B452E